MAEGTQLRVDEVRRSYGERAGEYAELLGDVARLAPEDRQHIAEWADSVTGRVLDAGCGPGHWTAWLHDRGVDIGGIDLVPEFVEIARRRSPQLDFEVGDLAALPTGNGTLGGILSWYSIIHAEPDDVPRILAEFARCIRPGGSLLLGFFRGPRIERFDHAVAPAWYLPITALQDELVACRFEVVETVTRNDPHARPHGAIVARRRARG